MLIAGAGIGGLTTALLLARHGHAVTLLESVSTLRPLGVGINVLPHAVRVLAALGLLPVLEAQAVATGELCYFNRHGQAIWREPRGRFAGHSMPQLSIHRGALHMTLLKAVIDRLGPEAVRTGTRVIAGADAGDHAVATVHGADAHGERRETLHADVLIGADGIHSTLRAQQVPNEGPPRYSGRLLWRGTTRARPFLSGRSMIMACHMQQKFVCYPITPPDASGRQLINWVAELPRPLPPNREDWNRPGRLADFLPAFESWRFDWLDVPSLIEQADASFEFPMVDRDPLPAWGAGRITLLGDAAHPMYPIGSNGASQAILDAEALANCLDTHADVVTAVAAYTAARLPATAAIVAANRGNGPEQCMELAEQRAPQGFRHIDEVFAPGELQAIADRYKVLTGLQPDLHPNRDSGASKS
ncbi:MAG: flavin-dependent oxidoreductase [Gammaproteobacteria bacterium]